MKGRLILLLSAFSLVGFAMLIFFFLTLLPDKAFEPKKLESVPEKLSEPQITFLDPIRGDKNAKITIVEYSDFTCPLCQQIEPDLQAWVLEDYNKRRIVWKDAPDASTRPESVTAAMAARCAQDQGKFWEYHDKLMSERTNPTAENLKLLANNVGLKEDLFETCMSSDITRPIVQHGLEEAYALGLTGTPTLYLNGKLYTGPLSLQALRKATEK